MHEAGSMLEPDTGERLLIQQRPRHKKASMPASIPPPTPSSPITPIPGPLPEQSRPGTPLLQASEDKAPPENSTMRGALQKQMESRQARAQLEKLLVHARKPGSYMVTPDAYINSAVARPGILSEGNLAGSRWLEALDAAIDKLAKPWPSPPQEGGDEEMKKYKKELEKEKDKIRKKTAEIRKISKKVDEIMLPFGKDLGALFKRPRANWKNLQGEIFELKETALKKLDQQGDALIGMIETSLPTFIESPQRETFLSTAIQYMGLLIDKHYELIAISMDSENTKGRMDLGVAVDMISSGGTAAEKFFYQSTAVGAFLDTALAEWALTKGRYDALRYYEAHSDGLGSWTAPGLKSFIYKFGGTLANLGAMAQIVPGVRNRYVMSMEVHKFLSSQKASEIVAKADGSDVLKRPDTKGMPWEKQFESELLHVITVEKNLLNGIVGIISEDQASTPKLHDEEKSSKRMLKLSREMELVAGSLEELHRRLEDKLEVANLSGKPDGEESPGLYQSLMVYKSDIECWHFIAHSMALCARVYKDFLPGAEAQEAAADDMADLAEPMAQTDEEVLEAIEASIQAGTAEEPGEEKTLDAVETVTRELAAMDVSAESAASDADGEGKREVELSSEAKISGPVAEVAADAAPFIRDAQQYLRQAERNLKLHMAAWTPTVKREYAEKAIADFRKAIAKFNEAPDLGSEDLNELQACEAVVQQYDSYSHCEDDPEEMLKLILKRKANLSLPDDEDPFRKGFYEFVVYFPPIKCRQYCLDLDPFYPHIYVTSDAPGLARLQTRHIIRAHSKNKLQRKYGRLYEKMTGDKVKRPEFRKRSAVTLARFMARELAAREKREAETLDDLPVRIVPARRNRGGIEASLRT